ncbi:MAG: mitochondrial fission ELM1 family protein [Sneathiella sp.]|nr:mitochondrial fission ELM1 family protein [Sneathiella sp.]
MIPTALENRPENCWIVTDGSAGMENQCIGLAEAMQLDFVIKRIKTKKPWRWLPASLWLSPLEQLMDGSDLLKAPWPDILISCGRQAIPMSIAVRKAAKGKTFTVHIQTPNANPAKFDLVAVPEHDTLRGDNVIVSEGSLTRITQTMLQLEAKKFDTKLKELTAPIVTVLVGGNNRCYDVTPDTMRDLCAKLTEMHKQSGCFFLVTTSRRTGDKNTEILKKTLSNLPHQLWTGEGENPYFAYLEKCDAIVVTADSVNMVCEACTSGKPVMVYELPGGNKKFNFFHQRMQTLKYTRPFKGTLQQWNPPKLSETSRIASVVWNKWEQHRHVEESQKL